MKKVIIRLQDIHYGSLILVNINYPYHENKENTLLVPALENTPDILLERRAANTLIKIMGELDCGDKLVAVSGWRTKKEQTQIYNDSLAENGEDFTRRYVALPNHSEHQTGLAIDLAENLPQIDFIRPHFGDTGVCADFQKKSVKFGFVQRYSKGKESITGISCEPWHFRYVGIPHAEIMTQKGLCLEEYLEFLQQNSSFNHPYIHKQDDCRFEIFYLKASEEKDTVFEMGDSDIYYISGDNMGGFIVTNRGNIHE